MRGSRVRLRGVSYKEPDFVAWLLSSGASITSASRADRTGVGIHIASGAVIVPLRAVGISRLIRLDIGTIAPGVTRHAVAIRI